MAEELLFVQVLKSSSPQGSPTQNVEFLNQALGRLTALF